MPALLVTGTGTDVGKTAVTAALAAVAVAGGQRVAVLKPAQTGMAGSQPSDIDVVGRLVGPEVTRRELGRYPEPLAPNTAARRAGLPPVRPSDVASEVRRLSLDHDLVLVEGAGGLLARFDDDGATLVDVALELGAPVLVVAGPGLGTLNASALTVEALRYRGLACRGLVLGSWPARPDLAMRCNISDLPEVTGIPLLGALPEKVGDLIPPRFLSMALESLAPELGGTWNLTRFTAEHAPPQPGQLAQKTRDQDHSETAAHLPGHMTPTELIALDRAHVWHPYAPMPGRHQPLVIESASGTRLRLARPIEGMREVVDGMSSWWAAIHGYAHPVLDSAVKDQLGRMSHVMFGGLTHEPAVRLAANLVEITPEPLQHVFLCDSGSVSVEVAFKMCLQYWRSLGRPEKRRMLTWRGGYHGDTLHPMTVCDPDGGMHHIWDGVLPRQVFADAPPAGFDAAPSPAYIQHLTELIETHAGELAAVVVEPVVQGAGGMRFHSPGYLRVLRELTRAHNVLLVFDEIATGFGRTGALFAADHASVAPDVMCVGKALTGGYLSMGAALCTAEVADGISRGELPVLAHGPTFMGNPLTCAVANASLSLLLDGDWEQDVKRIETGLRTGLAQAAQLPGVTDVRVLGAVGVVQVDHDVNLEAATRAAVQHGVWLRPFRNLIYTMPPYVAGDEDVARITEAMVAAAHVG